MRLAVRPEKFVSTILYKLEVCGTPIAVGLPDPTYTRRFGSGWVISPRVGLGRWLRGMGIPVLPMNKFHLLPLAKV